MALRFVLSALSSLLELSLRTQRCHRRSGGRSETANGRRERRQHADTQARKLLEAPPADTLKLRESGIGHPG
jgi:hypothetical protein